MAGEFVEKLIERETSDEEFDFQEKIDEMLE